MQAVFNTDIVDGRCRRDVMPAGMPCRARIGPFRGTVDLLGGPCLKLYPLRLRSLSGDHGGDMPLVLRRLWLLVLGAVASHRAS